MKYVICLLMLTVTARAHENNFGIYSNIQATDGHFDGLEIFYTPNKLLFQMAEGWPHNPILLDIRNISRNEYSAVHPEMGKMHLSFSEQQVEINFSDISYIQILGSVDLLSTNFVQSKSILSKARGAKHSCSM